MFPDPILTANLYASGLLDEAIRQVVAPFRREVRARDVQGSWRLWLVRYARGGEHLKIRLHGPAEVRPWAEEALAAAAARFFAGVTGIDTGPRRSREDAPPIDAEDEDPEERQDRSLVWTRYRRSQVSLGGKPFLLDDRYVALVIDCLSQGCEITLDALETAQGKVAPGLRQNALLDLLITGLAGAGLRPEGLTAYLAYHRDWLIRFGLRGHEEAGGPAALLQRFDAQTARMTGTLAPLRRIALQVWDGGGAGLDDDRSAWSRAVTDLLGHVRPLCSDPDYHLDPRAGDPVFPPLFKVCHGVANQLGLAPLEEAFAHHILLNAVVGPGEPEAR
jgi:hypothetical protein